MALNLNTEVTQIRLAGIYRMLCQAEMTVSEIAMELNLDIRIIKPFVNHLVEVGAAKFELQHGRYWYKGVLGHAFKMPINIHCDSDSGSLEKRVKEALAIQPFRDPLIWLSYGIGEVENVV